MYSEQLTYFIVSYQQRNFSKAARLIHMTPQGVAKAVHALEKELNVPLLLTHHDGALVPTAYADKLYVFALRSAEALTELKKELGSIKAKERDLLHIDLSADRVVL